MSVVVLVNSVVVVVVVVEDLELEVSIDDVVSNVVLELSAVDVVVGLSDEVDDNEELGVVGSIDVVEEVVSEGILVVDDELAEEDPREVVVVDTNDDIVVVVVVEELGRVVEVEVKPVVDNKVDEALDKVEDEEVPVDVVALIGRILKVLVELVPVVVVVNDEVVVPRRVVVEVVVEVEVV